MNQQPYRLALDGRPLAGSPNGYTTYICSIIDALIGHGIEITLVTDAPLLTTYEQTAKCTTVELAGQSRWRWEQNALRKHLLVADYDVYFAAANRGLPLRSVGRTKLAFGLLDVIPLLFPRLYLFRHKFYHIRRDLPSMLLSLWRADEVITISEASARDIKRLFPRKRITPILIRLGGKVMTASMPKKQFIYVGGNDPRKRIDSLVRAFAVFHASHPDFKLVLLGKGYEPFNDLIKHLQIDFAIDQPGYVNETTKWRLLSESQAVVYPSLYEGYGLAIGEAFLAGVPVICGKGGAQREVGGDAALYIDPMGPASITTAMEQVLDQSERARLQNLGKKQLATLTDPAIETATVDFFTKLAEQARA